MLKDRAESFDAAGVDTYGFGLITQTTPGITGYWQVNGRSDTTFAERVEMDVWYVRNWSVWIDLMYLAKTFKEVFAGKGAY